MSREEFETFRESLLKEVPDSVKEKISGICSDVELCKVLSENGVDLDAIENKIADAGFDMHKIGLQLPDTKLAGVNGGFYDSDFEDDVECGNCQNNIRSEFSKQYWASWFSKHGTFYRCRKCGYYTCIIGPSNYATLTPLEYKKL